MLSRLLLSLSCLVNLALYSGRVVLGALNQDDLFSNTSPTGSAFQLYSTFVHTSLLAAAVGFPAVALTLRGVSFLTHSSLLALNAVAASLCFWAMGYAASMYEHDIRNVSDTLNTHAALALFQAFTQLVQLLLLLCSRHTRPPTGPAPDSDTMALAQTTRPVTGMHTHYDRVV